jgi:hypothetical protein
LPANGGGNRDGGPESIAVFRVNTTAYLAQGVRYKTSTRPQCGRRRCAFRIHKGVRSSGCTKLQPGDRDGRPGLRAEIDSSRREAGVVAEGLRSEIWQVAEGVALANERIDDVDLRVGRLAAETHRGFADLKAEVPRLHEEDDRLAEADEELQQRVTRLESDRHR